MNGDECLWMKLIYFFIFDPTFKTLKMQYIYLILLRISYHCFQAKKYDKNFKHATFSKKQNEHKRVKKSF
jgi:hypothetical protein